MQKQFTIMRGVENTSFKRHPLPDELKGKTIEQVWLLLNEESLMKLGKAVHHVNAFLDDRMHDWEQKGDTLRYYAHSSGPGEVVDLVVYFK